jgi:triacylglycerol lipase
MQEDTSLKALIDPGDADNFFMIDGLPRFDPSATAGYSRGNALWLMETCRLVYREDEPSRKEFFERRAGLRETRYFNAGDTQGVMVRGEGFAALAFRGTLGYRDWLSDLDCLPVDWRGEGKVHEGFKKQFDAVWDDVKEELGRIDVPVFFAGHSLGAALATLAAAGCFFDGARAPAALYTFGSPRVGTTGFMHAFPRDFLHCRVVNDRDVVPTVPPRQVSRLIRPDFHHVGVPHIIEHDGHMRRGELHDDIDGVASPFGGILKGLAFWRSKLTEILAGNVAGLTEKFTDHAPVNYTARIERAGDLL